MIALAENKRFFSLFHSKWLRTKERDLLPKQSLEQVIIKRGMLVYLGDGSSPESFIVATKDIEWITVHEKLHWIKQVFLKSDTHRV